MLKEMISITGLLILSLALPASAADLQGRLKIDPATVEATTFYDGANVRVNAEVPEGYEIAVVCRGKEAPVELKRKGRVLGVLWMNVGDVSFERIPTMYKVQTSASLDELAEHNVLSELEIGYPALLTRSSPKGSGFDAGTIFDELVKLKKDEGLFSVEQGFLKLHSGSPGRKRVETVFRVPAKAPPGDYQVRVMGFKDGRGELLASGELKITQIGTAAFISSLARQHGLLYGILAAFIAVVVGLLTGVVFGLGSKGGH
jgi:uncharacterized protein (TIGR02186 family)